MNLPLISSVLDLSGPAFLVLYAAAWFAVLMITRALKRHFLSGAPPPAGTERRLSAYELASLAGGPARAVATALTRLTHQSVLAPATEGRPGFAVQQPLPIQAHELERLLYREIELSAGSPPTLSTLSRLETRHPRPFSHLEDRLKESGWLVDPAASRTRWVRAGVALSWLALIALGVTKLSVGVSRDRPVGLLVFLLLVTAVSLWVTLRLPRVTQRGEALLSDLARRNAALRTTLTRGSHSGHNVSHEDLLLGVALFGTVVLVDGPLAWMEPTRPSPSSSGDGGSSSSSSCGGGDSGGGGGGCGGCGGGGGCS